MFRSVTPILSIIVAILLYIFYTDAQYQDIKTIQAEIADYHEAVEKYNDFNTSLQDLVSRKDAIDGELKKRLEQFLPKTLDTSRILVDLESLASRNGLLFGNIKIDEKETLAKKGDQVQGENTGALVSLDISFDVIGTYPQMKSFLTETERSLSLMEVTKLSFTTVDSNFQQYSFTLRAYALQEKGN